MHLFGDSASIILGFGLSKGQMLRVMGPLEKGKHVGKWNKITMEPCTSFEIKALTEMVSRLMIMATIPHCSSAWTEKFQ